MAALVLVPKVQVITEPVTGIIHNILSLYIYIFFWKGEGGEGEGGGGGSVSFTSDCQPFKRFMMKIVISVQSLEIMNVPVGADIMC